MLACFAGTGALLGNIFCCSPATSSLESVRMITNTLLRWSKNSYLPHHIIIDTFSQILKWKITITSFVIPEEPNTWANKSGLNFMMYILIFVENCLQLRCDTWFFSMAKLIFMQRILFDCETIIEINFPIYNAYLCA